MSNVIQMRLGNAPMLPKLREELEFIRLSEFSKTSELTRKPKLSFPSETTPNVVCSLDVMAQKIRNAQTDILLMLHATPL